MDKKIFFFQMDQELESSQTAKLERLSQMVHTRQHIDNNELILLILLMIKLSIYIKYVY